MIVVAYLPWIEWPWFMAVLGGKNFSYAWMLMCQDDCRQAEIATSRLDFLHCATPQCVWSDSDCEWGLLHWQQPTSFHRYATGWGWPALSYPLGFPQAWPAFEVLLGRPFKSCPDCASCPAFLLPSIMQVCLGLAWHWHLPHLHHYQQSLYTI